MRRSRIRQFAAAIAVAIALVPSHAVAWTVQTTGRSVNDMRIRWQSAQPVYSGGAYAVSPSTAAPYAAGSLQPAFLADGLNAVNFMRYLAGLPDDVRLDTTLNRYDQHGTVILAANGLLTHYPAQPAAMSADFYATGKTGTSSSNLARGPVELETAVKLFMADSDAYNINKLGHRRWVLNPPMAKTGMGQTGSFSAMWALDRSRAEAVSYNSVCWPAAGQFPIEFFKAGTAWSASLNPDKYTVDPAGLIVTLRRVADGRTWTFNQADAYTTGDSFSGEIFSYSSNGYGIPSCVIFRPEQTLAYADGDAFDVTIGGTLYVKGTSTRTSVSYRTSFFTLAGPLLPNSRTVLTAPATVTSYSKSMLTASVSGVEATPLAGRGITFEYSTDSGSTWRRIASATTNASGTASAAWTPGVIRQKTLVRARYSGDDTLAGSAASKLVSVRPYMTLWAPTSATRSRAFGVTSYMAPRHALWSYPATVRAYKYVSGNWVYKTSFKSRVVYNSTTTSKMTASVVLPAGTWKLWVLHVADAYHVGAYSPARTVVVR